MSEALLSGPVPGHLENGVLVGHDGMLFLAGGAHRVLDQVSGGRPLRDDSFKAFRANHLVRRRYAERRGHRFLHIVTPDKQSFVTDLWPFRDRPFQRLGEMLLERLGSDGEGIDYPVDVLATIGREAASPVDTHYTDRASIVLAARTVELLTGEPQEERLATLLAGLTGRRTHAGDLGSKLDPVRRATDVVYAPALPGKGYSNDREIANNGIIDIWLNPSALYPRRLAFIGDSFGRDIARFLQFWFREIVFLRSPHLHAELVELFQPHDIVTQNVERYIGNMKPDGRRTHFLLLPHAKGRPYAPPPEFVETLSALLAVGRAPYIRLVRATFGAEPEA